MRKKFVASLLCAAALTGLLASPAAATFPDVTDPQLTEAVEVLRQLEVIHGKSDGTFDPQGSFTRAEFCKMALVVLGREQEAQLQSGRVIFSDVTAGHWALGYINAAALVKEGVTPLVQGRGDGSFAPDTAITCGEAVTILMRSLGYSDKDVGGDGGVWYSGHLLRARAIGLMDGLEALQGGDALTRAQAALLFENLLYTETKDSTDIFLKTVLGGSVGESQLVLEVKGKALTAGGWAVKTDKGSFVTFRSDLDTKLQGQRCKPVLDKEGNVLALQPDEEYTTRSVRLLTAEARYAVTETDSQLLIPAATPVWQGAAEQKSYSKVYKEIPYGAAAVLCYDKTDTLVSIYLMGRSDTAVTAVAGEGSDPFDGAWEGQPTAVYKNGVAVSLADVKPYDVGSFDPLTGMLELSDRKLTGVYENASPSPASPASVTVMGCSLPVLECALRDLRSLSLGDRVTLLLDGQNNVAGAVSASKVSALALGTATVTKGAPNERGRSTYEAQVALPWGITLKGEVWRFNDEAMELAPSKLYAVTSSTRGVLELTTPSSAPVTGDWQVRAKTLGSAKVIPGAAVYDKLAGGPLMAAGVDAVALSTVPARKISFLHRDNVGNVDLLVLDDVTGDGYTYGRIAFQKGQSGSDMSGSVPSMTVVSNAKASLELVTSNTYETLVDHFMGLAPSLSASSGKPRLAGSVELTAVQSVPRSAFGEKTVTAGGKVYSLAENIDDCCFNPYSETWFASLDEALSYSTTLTVYYDRTPEQGGKVRVVVAQ